MCCVPPLVVWSTVYIHPRNLLLRYLLVFARWLTTQCVYANLATQLGLSERTVQDWVWKYARAIAALHEFKVGCSLIYMAFRKANPSPYSIDCRFCGRTLAHMALDSSYLLTEFTFQSRNQENCLLPSGSVTNLTALLLLTRSRFHCTWIKLRGSMDLIVPLLLTLPFFVMDLKRGFRMAN